MWREDKEEAVKSDWMTWRKEKILQIKRGYTRSHFPQNSSWKKLRACRKTDYIIIIIIWISYFSAFSWETFTYPGI
jgi:hypothetical protein